MPLVRMLLSKYGGVVPEGGTIDTGRKTFTIDSARLHSIAPTDGSPPVARMPNGVPVVLFDSPDAFPCIHRGVRLGDEKCGTCGMHHKYVEVYACEKHKACSIRRPTADPRFKTCKDCRDRQSGGVLLDFGAFENKYAGKVGYVIGRGETAFDWSLLAAHDGPIFAINDAVLDAEKYAPNNDDIFLHVQDERMALPQKGNDPLILNRRAIGVFPNHGDFAHAIKSKPMPGLNRMLWYILAAEDDKRLLSMTREQLRDERRLYRAGWGTPNACGQKINPTICQGIMWAWYTGVERLLMVGCDGLDRNYRESLPNQSDSPITDNKKYVRAKQDAEFVMRSLGMKFEYCGTPV